MSSANKWIRIIDRLPPENKEVETKIDDDMGVRDERVLVYYNKMWFKAEDFERMYIRPTHWREKQNQFNQQKQ